MRPAWAAHCLVLLLHRYTATYHNRPSDATSPTTPGQAARRTGLFSETMPVCVCVYVYIYCRVSAYCSGIRQYNTPACLCMHTVYAYIAACGHIAEVPCTAKAPLPGRHRRPRCLQAATPLLGFLELLSQLKQNVFRSTVSVPQRLKSAHSALNRHTAP